MVNSKVLISLLINFVPGANLLNKKEERPVGKLLLLLCLAIHKIPQKCKAVPGSVSILSSIPLTSTSKIYPGSWNRCPVREGLKLGKPVLVVCISKSRQEHYSVSSVIMLMANFASKNMQARVQPLSLHLDSYKGTFWGTGALSLFMLYKFSKLLLLWFMPVIQKAYQTIIKTNYKTFLLHFRVPHKLMKMDTCSTWISCAPCSSLLFTKEQMSWIDLLHIAKPLGGRIKTKLL